MFSVFSFTCPWLRLRIAFHIIQRDKGIVISNQKKKKRKKEKEKKRNIRHVREIFLDFNNLFLETGIRREKKRERNINMWLPLARPPLGTWNATQARVLTGTQTSNPLVCRPALNPLSHTSQGHIRKVYISFISLNLF